MMRKTFVKDLDTEEPINFFDRNFDIAFGLNREIDMSYGYFSA